VKKIADEAKKDISVYVEQFANLQERAIDTARDITEGYIESITKRNLAIHSPI
jgi:hypothetical protein